jgi:RNA polymerase sigma-70 factor (ECF subfamily)
MELRRFAVSLAGGDADDLLQDAALIMLEHPPQAAGSTRGWLFKVVLNRWRMDRRSAARRRARELATANIEPVWQESLDHRRAVADLRAALAALPEPYRRVIVACYFEGKTSREVAGDEGIPAITVRTRLFRGLAKLRAAMTSRATVPRGPRSHRRCSSGRSPSPS